MPKEYTRRIPSTEVKDPTLSSVQRSVHASPVAVPRITEQDSMAGALLKGLSALNPALSSMAAQATAERRAQIQEQYAREVKLEQARGQAWAIEKKPVPAEATQAFRDSHSQTTGAQASIEDGQEFLTAYSEAMNTPGFEHGKFVSQFWDGKMKGLAGVDPLYAAAYTEGRAKYEAEAFRNRQKVLRDGLASNRQQAAEVQVTDLVKEYDPSKYAELRDRLTQTGVTREDYAQLVTQTAINASLQDGNIERLKKLMMPVDQSGWSPTMIPANGRAVEGAIQQIITKKRIEAGREVDFASVEATSELLKKAADGGVDDPSAAAFAHARAYPNRYDTTEKVQALVRQVASAAEEGQITNHAKRWLANPDDPLSRASLADPKVRSKVSDQINKAIANSNGDAQTIVQGLTEAQRGGIDVGKSIGLYVGFGSMTPNADGTLPEHMKGGLALLEMLDRTGNLHLAEQYMSSKDLTWYARYKEGVAGKLSSEDAAAQAYKQTSPDAKKREGEWNAQATKAVRKVGKELHSGWLDLDPDNTTAVDIEHLRLSKNYFLAGMSVEQAADQARKDLANRAVTIGDQRVLLNGDTPNLVLRDDLIKGANGTLEDLRAGDPDKNWQVLQDNQGNFVFTDYQTGAMVRRSREEIVHKAARMSAGSVPTPKGVVDFQNLRQRLDGRRISPMNVEKLGDMELENIMFNMSTLVGQGLIKPSEVAAIRTERGRRMAKATSTWVTSNAEYDKNVRPKGGKMTDADVAAVSMDPPARLDAAGKYGSPKDFALRYADKAPTAALTIITEGVRLEAYKDVDGHLTIGAGYQMSSKDPKVVRLALRDAGVPERDIDGVMKGKVAITPEAALLLTQNEQNKVYAPAARRHFEMKYGEGAWQRLQPNERAALTYLEWNTGNLAQYPKLMEALAKDDIEAAVKEVEISFTKAGKKYSAKRAVSLVRSMLRGTGDFKALVNKGV